MGAQNNKNKKSALKQLKSSLNSAGFIGPKSQISKKDKKKGHQKASAQKSKVENQLRAIQESMNPFGIQKGRNKQDVMGMKRKGQVGNPVAARQKALEYRKNTLLVELQNRNRTGAVNDRRFGENDTNMSVEEKMLERFTKERQKRSRNGSMFNLNDGDDDDGEGEEISLTHFGQSLAEIDDFNDVDLAVSDEEDSGAIDQETVSHLHFGGFETVDDHEEVRIIVDSIMNLCTLNSAIQ